MQKISRLLKIITAAATLLLVIYLGWSCVDVYLVGNSAANIADGGVHIAPVFTREIAAERLSPLLPWVLGYAVLVAVTSFVQSQAASDKKRPHSPLPCCGGGAACAAGCGEWRRRRRADKGCKYMYGVYRTWLML